MDEYENGLMESQMISFNNIINRIHIQFPLLDHIVVDYKKWTKIKNERII